MFARILEFLLSKRRRRFHPGVKSEVLPIMRKQHGFPGIPAFLPRRLRTRKRSPSASGLRKWMRSGMRGKHSRESARRFGVVQPVCDCRYAVLSAQQIAVFIFIAQCKIGAPESRVGPTWLIAGQGEQVCCSHSQL